MFPTTVLAAVDGSETAEHAAREASRLCWRTGSELHVVYVAPIPVAWSGAEALAWQAENERYARELEDFSRREGRRILEEQLEKIDGSGAGVSGSHLKLGRVDALVSELAEDLGAGLLVVGNRGYGALRRTLMGSVSTSLIHHAHCPVLVTRATQGASSLSTGDVLVAYDGSRESERAAETGGELAAAFEADLHLANVVDVSKIVPFAHPYAQMGWEKEVREAGKEAEKHLEEVAARIEGASGVPATLHVRSGQPSVELVSLGEELGAGLTLVGSRGRGGIRRALLGSVSTRVTHHALGSVLVFRPLDDAPAETG